MKKKPWSFKENVKNFDLHIEKSVPDYKETHELVKDLSTFLTPKNSVIYDFGCSTGKLLNKIAIANKDKKIKCYGFDESYEMIKFAKKIYKNISFQKKDINKINLIKKSNLSVLIYTLQFIPKEYKEKLLKKIYKNLNYQGCLVIFEKINITDGKYQDIFNFLHFDFKRKNNFSEKEILEKEYSLRGLMTLYTEQMLINKLKKVGFKRIIKLFQKLNFVGFIATKQ